MMAVIKLFVSAGLIVAVTELSRRNIPGASLLVSLPLVSLLAMGWMYQEQRDAHKLAEFATGTFWMVLPSLALFVVFPWLVRRGWSAGAAMTAGVAATVVAYVITAQVVRRFGVSI